MSWLSVLRTLGTYVTGALSRKRSSGVMGEGGGGGGSLSGNQVKFLGSVSELSRIFRCFYLLCSLLTVRLNE